MKFPSPITHKGDCIYRIPLNRSGNPRSRYRPAFEKDDYNRTKYEGTQWVSHRLSYHLNIDNIPMRPLKRGEGLVLHTCDNKWCINPEHLYLGSTKDNAIDNANRNAKWRKNRSEAQKKIGFPEVSPEGRKRMAEANSQRMKAMWRENREQALKDRGLL